jgi:hypothetical protein
MNSPRRRAILVMLTLSLAVSAGSLAERAPGAKPVVAVIAHNHGTEPTDFLVPFGVLAGSGLVEVHALALAAGR